MPVLDAATDNVLLGSSQAAAVYVGPTQVWAGLDRATSAYLTATGLDVFYAPVLDGLVRGLKSAGLWSKMTAIYPFIGGTAALHKWNLKDPRDADDAYRLTFTDAGTSAHTTDLGYLANTEGNNINGGYADTHLVPLTALPDVNSTHLAYYSLAEVTPGDRAEMGCYDWNGAASRFHIIACYASNAFYYGMSEQGATYVNVPSSTGLFVTTRTAATVTTAYRNGAQVDVSPAPADNGLPNFSVWVGGIDSYRGCSDLPCGFASVGAGLTAQNVTDLNSVVQTYQTTLRAMHATFAPTDIPGLGLWLDAQRITSLADGDPVHTWFDVSPAARNAVSLDAAAPKYRGAAVNSKPAVEFTGTSAISRMQIPGWGTALTGSSHYTLFVLVSQRGDYSSYPIITTAPVGDQWDFITEYNADGGVFWGHGNGCYRCFAAAAPVDAMHLLTFVSNGGAATSHFYFNGTEPPIGFLGPSGDMQSAIPNIGTDVILGGYYNAQFGIDGYLCALLWYDHTLADPDRLAVENYLKGKWGL